MQYTINARRSNVVIGPGTYNGTQYSLLKTRKPCLVTYVIYLYKIETLISCKDGIAGIYNGKWANNI